MTAEKKTKTARASEGSNSSGPNVFFNSWLTGVKQSVWVVAL